MLGRIAGVASVARSYETELIIAKPTIRCGWNLLDRVPMTIGGIDHMGVSPVHPGLPNQDSSMAVWLMRLGSATILYEKVP
jgi:hypothetical protein